MSAKDELILKLGRNHNLAHQTLFGHRHPDETPEFHFELQNHWHSAVPKMMEMVFRGGAKSTISEEAITIKALYNRFRNGLIIGSNSDRANERLRAIKHEIENNDFIHELFGDLRGDRWNEDSITLRNGIIIQAVGRGQSLRGVKHLEQRPDLMLGDDMEEQEDVETPEARKKFARWFMAVAVPALDPKAIIRVNATPLDPQAFAVKLLTAKDWLSKRYPIEYKDPETGERRATWESRFPLSYIDALRKSFAEAGETESFLREYMLEAEDPATKRFTADMIKVVPTVRTWHPTQAFYDPARTTNKLSASTGKVVFSWVGPKLVVWDGAALTVQPDQMVNDIFETDDTYQPTRIGVEEDGLNEFLMQPLRHEQTRRRRIIPVKPFKAPKGKFSFIEGLQPFFKAHEIEFAKDLPDLKTQLLSYPTGRIDVPNALAYALRMRPGLPMYDGFGALNIVPELGLIERIPTWLCVNSTGQYVTAVLCQLAEGAVHVVADWLREGDPGAVLSDIVQEARMESERDIRFICPPRHFDSYDTMGMRPSAKKIPIELRKGGPEQNGREELRAMMKRLAHGRNAVLVSQRARWTLGAFASGYCRAVLKTGVLDMHAEEGVYKTLMEGLESFTALLKTAALDGTEAEAHYAVDARGVRYLTARPQR